jgi:hypothetical protein
MKSKMPAAPPGCDPEAPENSRRNFLKQSALITAVALPRPRRVSHRGPCVVCTTTKLFIFNPWLSVRGTR